MGLYEVSLLGCFGIGTMLANFHVRGMFLLAVLNMLCFRGLIFNLLGPCELLFLLCFIASWTRVVVSVSYILVFCAFLCWCVSVCLVLRVCEFFGETIRNAFGCG